MDLIQVQVRPFRCEVPWEWCWILVALRPAPIPPVVPSGPLGVSPNPPAVPSGPRGVSVPSGLFGVPPYSPACPPVPLVSLGSYSSIVIV